MTSKDALKLLNMFTEATQIARKQNKFECKWEVDETTFANLLKKAFPKIEDANKMAKRILENN
ncbi:TPA: hypothetical protein CPT79_02725 [Candidatus Gastranaerophilales bacterium HUM_6]|nr:unknown [Fusobacterium sp. CAG:815]DAA92624.1 MAG TPA: hypothetical protein CPT79_02725 [Candidatus Gastranaerophilales bacterium HUM_6]DAA92718.1 MAG TPA: hypothetical protein CPT93_06075 [Candidatus Gastranaerophilales bacterium HUM_7]DAB08830.1 MAG TPA: hypothetical protein CPT78_01265 [Candidatus Gastranaerophilales bacterium HUM_14]